MHGQEKETERSGRGKRQKKTHLETQRVRRRKADSETEQRKGVSKRKRTYTKGVML